MAGRATSLCANLSVIPEAAPNVFYSFVGSAFRIRDKLSRKLLGSHKFIFSRTTAATVHMYGMVTVYPQLELGLK
jgi:hypothetical protein